MHKPYSWKGNTVNQENFVVKFFCPFLHWWKLKPTIFFSKFSFCNDHENNEMKIRWGKLFCDKILTTELFLIYGKSLLSDNLDRKVEIILVTTASSSLHVYNHVHGVLKVTSKCVILSWTVILCIILVTLLLTL